MVAWHCVNDVVKTCRVHVYTVESKLGNVVKLVTGQRSVRQIAYALFAQ